MVLHQKVAAVDRNDLLTEFLAETPAETLSTLYACLSPAAAETSRQGKRKGAGDPRLRTRIQDSDG